MAYNLEPLVQILDQILHPTDNTKLLILDPNTKPQLASLLEKVCSLKDLFDCSASALNGNQTEILESQTRVAAHEAEDVLESHITDRILSTPEGESITISPPDLRKVIEEFDSVKEELVKLHGSSSAAVVSSTNHVDPNPKNIVVGFGEDLDLLKDQLTGGHPDLEIIPIVGMGGMGKTTLARTLYNNQSVNSEFDRCAWVTISQDYNKRRVLMDLLSSVKKEKLKDEEDVIKLQVDLHKILNTRRYLIVVDDVWRTSDWDDMRHFFPNNGKGSRIIVTSRESTVADYVKSKKHLLHQMHFLNEDHSWKLFCQIMFPTEAAQLEALAERYPVAKRIAKNCGGLPLVIHVIGGLLSRINPESWEEVATDVGTAAASDDKAEHFSKILSLSYNHLPHHLRPCFLYMATFPEDYLIRSSRLIMLWEAEGFLKPVKDKSLKEAAEEYLNALVDRNLIFVHQRRTKEIVKSYGIHDVLRDLCVKKAREENFLHVEHQKVNDLPGGTSRARRVIAHKAFHTGDMLTSKVLMPLSRSFVSIEPLYFDTLLSPVFFDLRLLRVLDLLVMNFPEFPQALGKLVNLRLLALTCPVKQLASSIHRLLNLQTLICKQIKALGGERIFFGSVHELFDLPQLRDLMLTGFCLTDFDSCGALETLQSLSIVYADLLPTIARKYPNLKKLHLYETIGRKYSGDTPLDVCLNELEKLKYEGTSLFSPLICLTLPTSLRRLTLIFCKIPPDTMNEIGNLPNLQVLKLECCEFNSWEPTEGQFESLEILVLQNSTLVTWEAYESNFQKLQRLHLRYCYLLEEIPIGIGDIPTLEMIEVTSCSPSAEDSAREIESQQRDNFNDGLQVLIKNHWTSD